MKEVIDGEGSFTRGVAFYRAWEVIHRLTEPLPQPVYDPTRRFAIPDRITTTVGSTAVPWADFWQLEDRNGNSVLKSNTGFVSNAQRHDQDRNSDGILDGYGRTYHLHVEDKPNVGMNP